MVTVQFTQTAEDDYLALIDYLSRRSIDDAIALDQKMDTLVENLKKYKHFCPPSRQFPKFRKCVITPSISLIYEIGKASITIISVFDNRSNTPFT
jgi:plasmid stabilization system protein ParE